QAEREVQFPRLFELLLLRIGEHTVGERLDEFVREGRQVQLDEVAVDAHLRRGAGRQMQVRAAPLRRGFQQIQQVHRGIASGIHYSTVSLTTSSSVVTPSLTLRKPLCRSVTMPSAMAAARMADTGALSMTLCRKLSVISITSNNPTRPL